MAAGASDSDASRGVCVFFKESNGPEDEYRLAAEARGWDAHFVPVLGFELTDPAVVVPSLALPLAAIVVTSPRASLVLARALELSAPAKPSSHSFFAVGETTARPLVAQGMTVRGTECGNADALADRMLADLDAAAGPVLFLCGDKRRDTLPERLGAHGFRVVEVQVYRSVPAPPAALDDAWDPALGRHDADPHPVAAVFFSPSGVDTVHASPRWRTWIEASRARGARERGREGGGSAGGSAGERGDGGIKGGGAGGRGDGRCARPVTLVAAGPATATALRNVGWEPSAVAEKPNARVIVDAATRGGEREG